MELTINYAISSVPYPGAGRLYNPESPCRGGCDSCTAECYFARGCRDGHGCPPEGEQPKKENGGKKKKNRKKKRG